PGAEATTTQGGIDGNGIEACRGTVAAPQHDGGSDQPHPCHGNQKRGAGVPQGCGIAAPRHAVAVEAAVFQGNQRIEIAGLGLANDGLGGHQAMGKAMAAVPWMTVRMLQSNCIRSSPTSTGPPKSARISASRAARSKITGTKWFRIRQRAPDWAATLPTSVDSV